jgi:hypothetical protein
MADNARETKAGGGEACASRPYNTWLLLGGVGLALLGFTAGRLSATPTAAAEVAWAHGSGVALVQTLETPPDPRELIPLPGPGLGPGMEPGEDECPIYLYQDGQLYRLMPGQPDGQLPGPPGSPELFPLEPVPGFPSPPPTRPEPRPSRPGTLRV